MADSADVAATMIESKLSKLERLRMLEVAKATGGKPLELLDHQKPPPGQWYVWFLLAGRGAGKTQACASYYDRFMRHHPGARGGIAAPTLGDAVEACVRGPSGLIAINPRVKLIGRTGGTYVVWPNGSEALLFGAYTREDVQRFRAGGNRNIYWCCRQGTLIETDAGQVAIEDVRAGNRVLTRTGYQSVRRAWCSGWRDLWKLTLIDGRALEATADHLVLTARGWVPLALVGPCDIVTSCTSNTKASGGIAARPATTPTHGAASCIATSGSERSGRSPTATSSTTATVSAATTTSPTSRSSRANNTPDITLPAPMDSRSDWRPSVANLASHRADLVFASSAARTSSPIEEPPGTALRIVERSVRDLGSLPHALNAEPPSTVVPISPPLCAPVAVARCEPTGYADWVWDLAVDGQPEFVASGIVVHNCEEPAAWRNLKEAWEIMEMGLRLGDWPHIIASSTPRARPKLKEILNDPETVRTSATIHDNPHLPEAQRRRLVRRHAGTRLEAQELLGQYIEDVEGALWTYETIARTRVIPDDVPELTRVAVGVDPSGGDEDGNDEQGIIVAGRGVDGHAYVLADRSCKLSPAGWGRRAVVAYDAYKANVLVAEKNFGGDMVTSTIQVAAREVDQAVVVKPISVSRGKAVRAEPISALYEQGLVHHVGEFPELESQMRNWTTDAGWSPDRLDALVFALSEFALRPAGKLTIAVPQGVMPTSLTRS